MTPDLRTIPTVELLDEVIRRVTLEGERILSISAAALRRRAEDFDHAYAAHPARRSLSELLDVRDRGYEA
jgi:hypothetical protein